MHDPMCLSLEKLQKWELVCSCQMLNRGGMT